MTAHGLTLVPASDVHYATNGTINVRRSVARVLVTAHSEFGFHSGGFYVEADEVVEAVQAAARERRDVRYIPERGAIVRALRCLTSGARGEYVTSPTSHYMQWVLN